VIISIKRHLKRRWVMSEILGTLFKYLVSLLGVAAVVLVLYQVFGANKTQQAMSDMTQLQSNSQSLYSSQNTFTTLTTAVAIGAKLAPSSMITGATLTNPWGGTVAIAVNAGNATQFDITEPNVPNDACAKMGVGINTAVGLKINGTALALPIDAGTAATKCDQTANTLVFTFGH
jgi:type II secretory pathway pseudopilin PulG